MYRNKTLLWLKNLIDYYVINICKHLTVRLSVLSINMQLSKVKVLLLLTRKHLSILSSFMTYYRVCNQSGTTAATSGAAATYSRFVVRFVLLHLQFSVQINICSFALFLLGIVWSILRRFTDSDYPFCYLQTLHRITITDLILLYFDCPNVRPGCLSAYIVVMFVFNGLK